MSTKTKAKGGNRILSIRAKNVKRIRELVIDEVGDIHEVRGDTDQGKTSILDSIEGCLRGMDKSMVSRGADRAELELVMSEATVKRIVSAGEGRDTLMVTGADGKAVEKAADFLRTIYSPETFRPLNWVQLGGGEKKGSTERRRLQRDQLLEALDVSLDAGKLMGIILHELGEDHVEAIDQINLDGIDFEQHPFIVARAFLQRCKDFFTIKNAEKTRAEEVLRHTPAPEIPAPKASLTECRAEAAEATKAYHEAKAVAALYEEQIERRDSLARRVAESAAELPDAAKVQAAREKYGPVIRTIEREIEEKEAQLRTLRENLDKARNNLQKVEEAERKIERHTHLVEDLAEVEKGLERYAEADFASLGKAEAEAHARAQARELQDRHDEAAAVVAEASRTAGLYQDLVELFRDGIPKILLSEAQLPVQGLSVDDETILIDGVPLHQLGTSRQMRLGVLIAHALNPRSGFVLVDGAESMGSNDRKALAETAAELGLQLIMTIVDPEAVPREGVTVMRDGERVA